MSSIFSHLKRMLANNLGVDSLFFLRGIRNHLARGSVRIDQPLSMPQVRRSRVLVISPHPDDEAIGAGGTLAMHGIAGSDVHIVYLSHGETVAIADTPDEVAVIRHKEAEALCGHFGFSGDYLRLPDGNVKSRLDDAVRQVAKIVQEFRPTTIFLPFLFDIHSDHRTSNVILAKVLDKVDFSGEIWTYEVWGAIPSPSVVVNVTEVAEEKRKMIDLYGSQLPVADFHGICENRGRLRFALHVDTLTPGLGEAFEVMPPEVFKEIVADYLRREQE